MIVRKSLPLYEMANTKKKKSRVVMEIVDRIRKERPEGGFIRKDYETGRWIEIGETKAREVSPDYASVQILNVKQWSQ